ncbi:hypothetical protein HK414_26220 [Ramlibacter terrae]|uniref:Uncharacterized protein n=1 Tax=Ramlibacter terrae TaxID=2732511 RepID=A0ABX6P5W4_9BURK|nr:hypothetical protein HK414_26220 [Ramlibacter terrae]
MGTTSAYEGHGSTPDVLAAYRELWEHGDLTMRMAMTVSPRWRSYDEAAIVMRDWAPLLRGRGMGDAQFRVSGFFIAHGGDPCARAVRPRTWRGAAGRAWPCRSTPPRNLRRCACWPASTTCACTPSSPTSWPRWRR